MSSSNGETLNIARNSQTLSLGASPIMTSSQGDNGKKRRSSPEEVGPADKRARLEAAEEAKDARAVAHPDPTPSTAPPRIPNPSPAPPTPEDGLAPGARLTDFCACTVCARHLALLGYARPTPAPSANPPPALSRDPTLPARHQPAVTVDIDALSEGQGSMAELGIGSDGEDGGESGVATELADMDADFDAGMDVDELVRRERDADPKSTVALPAADDSQAYFAFVRYLNQGPYVVDRFGYWCMVHRGGIEGYVGDWGGVSGSRYPLRTWVSDDTDNLRSRGDGPDESCTASTTLYSCAIVRASDG